MGRIKVNSCILLASHFFYWTICTHPHDRFTTQVDQEVLKNSEHCLKICFQPNFEYSTQQSIEVSANLFYLGVSICCPTAICSIWIESLQQIGSNARSIMFPHYQGNYSPSIDCGVSSVHVTQYTVEIYVLCGWVCARLLNSDWLH